MTAYTSTQSGLASANSTWGGGGHPSADADTFTITIGHNVTWDLNLSTLTNGLGACTVNGGFEASTVAGTYGVKVNGNWTFGASAHYYINNGLGNVYPADCTFIRNVNGNFSHIFASATVIDVRCQDVPTHFYVHLSQAESLGATTLHIDADLTGESTYWGGTVWGQPGLIRIDNINQAAQSELRTISSITASTIVITAGLTAAKLQGTYIILISRNIKTVGVTTGTAYSSPNSGYVAEEIRDMNTGMNGASNSTIGGTISNCISGAFPSSGGGGVTNNAMISACTTGAGASFQTIAGLISGCTTGIGLGGLTGTGLLTGTVTGCATGVSLASSLRIVGGSVVNCTTGVNQGSGFNFQSATFSNNTRDVSQISDTVMYNTLLGSATEFLNYNVSTRPIWDYVESNDHDQVAGAFKSWNKGGIVTSVASPVYDSSRVRSYRHAPESATAYVFMQRQVLAPAGASLYVRCYVQKDASMSFLPRLQIFAASKEPLISGSADATVIMTNSTNTWEILEATITNTTTAPVPYIVRTLAQNASGNVYFDPLIRLSSYQFAPDMAGGNNG